MVFFNAQSYTLPTVVSVLLHGVVLYFVVVGWQASSEERKIPTPKYIPAKLVQLEKTAPKAAPKPQPRTIDRAAEQREKQRQAREAEAKRQADLAKQAQAKKQQAENERKQEEAAATKRREEAERLQQQKAREQELADALADEEAVLQSEQDAELVNSFSDVIYSRVYRNWSYPPSTRRGMRCELSVTLVPTGRVVDVTMKKSSGNSAFDRSAEQAVWKAEQFPELQELPARVFEKNFRNITLTFEPQDTRL